METQGLAGANVHTSIDAINRQVQSEHPEAVRSAAAGDGSVTIMFEDIAGSTTTSERIGDDAWLEVIRRHNAIVREQVQAHDGREVVNRGDGFMVVFTSPKAAVECAVAIQKAFAATDAGSRKQGARPNTPGIGGQGADSPPTDERTSRPADQPISVHIGLHTGRPAQDEGNFYGTDVNLAARIADHVAQAGQIVVSERMCELLRSDGGVSFDDGRDVELKGLSGRHRVFGVLWR
jgi:class 3 adenylate cyclase